MANFFKNKNILFCVLIINLQISFISSNFEKCYSIDNCLKCPELDYCDECQSGYKLNKPKTKCKGGENNKKPQTPKAEIKKPETPKAEIKNPQPPNAPVEIKKNENPVLNKPVISVSKAPNNPFQNIPVSSLQKFKDRNANNEIINKILIFILIILVLSIVASLIYNFVKKKFGKGYTEEDGQEETAKVVYIR